MQAKDPEDGSTLYQKALEAACATMKEIIAGLDFQSWARIIQFATSHEASKGQNSTLDELSLCFVNMGV